MPLSPSPDSHPRSPSLSLTVSRLRAAGCVFAEDEALLLISAARDEDELAAMVERRAAGLPLEHIVGWAEFRGLRIAVDPGVFVPRRRTEFLVERALAAAYASRETAAADTDGGSPARRPLVVDLCCGSGAVGAALLAELETAELYASDIDGDAVRCARRNIAGTAGNRSVHVLEGDLYAPLPRVLRGRVDVLVANVPYVPSGSVGLLPAEAREHEPRVALDGGADGLDVLRRVAAEAARWLAPGGCLLAETSEAQAPHALDVLAGHGLLARASGSEELGATVVTGTLTGTLAGPLTGPRAADGS